MPVVAAATVNGLAAPVPVLVVPLLVDVQVAEYPVIGLPPLLSGAVNDTFNPPVTVVVELDSALAFVGAPGTFATVTAFDAADGALGPTPLVAVTVHVYVLPALSDATATGLEACEPVRVVPKFEDVHVAV